MKRKVTFYLTSIPAKVLAVIMTVAIGSLAAVFIVYSEQVPWYVILFFVLLTGILIFFLFIFFFNRITIDSDREVVKIFTIKKKRFGFQDIQDVEVDTNFSLDVKKYCFIAFRTKDLKIYKIPGYSSILNRNSVQKSTEIVEEINNILGKKKETELFEGEDVA